jgi:hypothetical protein
MYLIKEAEDKPNQQHGDYEQADLIRIMISYLSQNSA